MSRPGVGLLALFGLAAAVALVALCACATREELRSSASAVVDLSETATHEAAASVVRSEAQTVVAGPVRVTELWVTKAGDRHRRTVVTAPVERKSSSTESVLSTEHSALALDGGATASATASEDRASKPAFGCAFGLGTLLTLGAMAAAYLLWRRARA